MPKIRRRLPPALLRHLVSRMRQRDIREDQAQLLSEWLDTDPDVPEGAWFKRFPGMIVCGNGELVSTFLRLGQIPHGSEVI